MDSEFTPTPEIKNKSENKYGGIEIVYFPENNTANHENWRIEERIYNNYKEAITRRGREALHEQSFSDHFFEGGSRDKIGVFGSEKDGYILGSEVDDIFVPTHFAPEGLKSGYRLLKDLLDSDKPTALFLTDDLVATLRKMDGWIVLPFKMKMKFRGAEVEKQMVVSHLEAVPKLLVHALKKDVERRVSDAKWHVKNFIEDTTSKNPLLKEKIEEFTSFKNKVKKLFEKQKPNIDEIEELFNGKDGKES